MSLICPIDEQMLDAPALASVANVDPALARASGAHVPELSIRLAALRALADRLEADAEAIAALTTLEIGCPKDQAVALQVKSACGVLRALADLGEVHDFASERKGLRGGRVQVRKLPVGVVAGIVPWNVPLFLASVKLGAALATGCPIILKPSPENALSMARFAEHVVALGLPEGLVQMLIGDRDVGAALVADARVAKVSFTGSTRAGAAIGQICAARFARCTLELGGKSAAILLDDCDIDAVAPELFLAMLQNNGQVCGAQSRLLVPAHKAARFTEQLVALFQSLRTGDPRQAGIHIGPVATDAQWEKISGMISAALRDGAKPLAGADFSALPDRGYYVPPTLFAATPDMVIAREEIFGPVTVVMPYRDDAEAVALANDSAYGLSGSIWSPDIARAARLAAQLRTGTVGINSKKILDFGAPFGGFRASGVGRELGPEGLDAYLEPMAILIPEAA
jgi:aldehyde dehydrogenase (NAD+)